MDLIFEDFVYFLKKQSNFGQSIQWIWLEMFPDTQNSQFYFSSDHGCEVTLKNVWKSIFPCFVINHKFCVTKPGFTHCN